MTKAEYDKATSRLSVIWPNFAPEEETDNAWFGLLSDMSPAVFYLCLRLATQREEWRPWSTLPAVVNRYEEEARRILVQEMERRRENDPARMLEEKISEEQRLENLKRIKELVATIPRRLPE